MAAAVAFIPRTASAYGVRTERYLMDGNGEEESPAANYATLTPMVALPTIFPNYLATCAPDFELQDGGDSFGGSNDAPGTDDCNSTASESEESSENKCRADPFAPHCKIPLPTPFSPYDYWAEPTFIRRRNERERQRVRHVNDGFERLRNHLPLAPHDRDKRLSKVDTLRYAIKYIRHLQSLLGDKAESDEDSQ
ncbi:helix-loop-helix protein 6-like [Ornithodoros turicata]|uniref:helix-loop-helix protein 6-like n=1 Tax=Ornithodoros turicata TaxID=34597 RepID=UPI00313A482D